MHQINGALSRVANIKPDQLAASTGILERLIDQELLVQQANEKCSIATPRIAAHRSLRREILARAYLDQTLAQTGKPTDAEVKGVLRRAPDLFAKRRIYNLQELNIRLPARAPGRTARPGGSGAQFSRAHQLAARAEYPDLPPAVA